MSNFSRQGYKNLKADAMVEGIHTFSREGSMFGSHNGVSIAFAPTIHNSNSCRMINIAIAYCAPEDEYKDTHGIYQALLNYSQGETIQLPLGAGLRDEGAKEIGEYLLGVFGDI